MNPEVPTGSTDTVVQQYFNSLYRQYFDTIGQTYYIHWDIVLWIFFWVAILTIGFYAYTRWQRYTHNPEELYPVESYNGYIQESNGRVGVFLFLFFGVITVWLIFITINNLVNGQVY